MTEDDNQKDLRGGNGKSQEPPDLDKMIQDFIRKLHRFFSGKKPSEQPVPKSFPQGKSVGLIAGSIIFALFAVWILVGFYIVEPAEQAVVLRFGKYVATENPGLHWLPSIVESKYIVNIQEVSSYQYTSDMLTQDENIVNVSLVVQFRISDPKDYLFNVVNPSESLQQATASALRQVIGNTTLDGVLTKQRTEVRQNAELLLKEILALYKTGLEVTDVVLQPAKPPEEVTEAFDDAIKAREDEQRFVNKAQSYKNSVVPQAQGHAKRLLQESEAYQKQVVLEAKGRTARFLAVLPIYLDAPKVTRERMYLDALESVLQKSSKILISQKAGNNLLYLPLSKLLAGNKGVKNVSAPTNVENDLTESPANKAEKQLDNNKALRGDRGSYLGRGT